MNTLKAICCVAVFIAGLGLLGRADQVDQIIYTMDEDIYTEIVTRLSQHGDTPSKSEIADYFLENYCD